MGRFDALELNEAQQAKTKKSNFGEMLKDARYFIDLGEDHFYQLEYEQALKDYSAAVRIDGGAQEAWRGQLLCLLALEEYREVELWLKKAIELVGENADFLAIQALVCGRTGDFDRACGYSDAAMESSGCSPLPLIVRGELFLYCKRNGEYCFEQAYTLSPNWKTALLIAQGCLFSRRRQGSMIALKYVKTALDREPQRSELYLMLAKVNLALGRNREANIALDEAVALKSELRVAPQLRSQLIKRGFWGWLGGMFK